MLNLRLPILLALPALILLLLPGAQVTAAPTATPGFHVAVDVPQSNNGTEPSLAIPFNTTGTGPGTRYAGTRYVSWQGPGEFNTSQDGFTFSQSSTTPASGAGGDVTNAVSYSGALYNGQICGLPTELHSCIWRSLDGGATWLQRNMLADNHPGASDRPWIDVYPKFNTTPTASNPDNDRIYLEFHTFSPDDLVYVTTSTDGGANFGAPIPIETGTNAAIPNSGCNTIPGGIAVDQATGKVFALWLSGPDIAANVTSGCNYSQIGPFNQAWVSVSSDGGTTWLSSLAWQGGFNQTNRTGDNADKIFSTITVDDAHQVHIALTVRHNDDPVGFVAQCQANQGNCSETPQDTDLYLVTSPDIHLLSSPLGAAHWTLPLKINKTQGSFFFPWLSAGSAGRLAAAYYSSTTRQPNLPSSVWNAGFSQVTGAVATYTTGANATYTSPPVVTDEILLNPGSVHGNGTTGGGICTFGLFCAAVPGSNRGLADVFEVHVDPAGGANVTWTQDRNGKTIQFACQQSGASAFAGAPDLNGCYGPADMSLTKTDTPDPVATGQNLTYHLTVRNLNGAAPGGLAPATTSGVTVVDTLPAGVTLVSATPSSGSCSGSTTITCTFGASGIFPGAATGTVDIVVHVTAATGTVLTNTATVSALTADPVALNNTATTTTNVSGPTAVGFQSAKASRTGAGVVVRWRTASEAGLVGFNVYRERSGVRTKLNRALIAGAGSATRGHAYSFVDRRAPRVSVRYWLQEVGVSGAKRWHGPIRSS